MRKKLKLTSGVLTAILAVFVLMFVQKYQNVETTPAVNETQEVIVEKPKSNFIFGINADSLTVIESSIKKNEFLANILLPHHIDYVSIDRLAKKSKEVFDVRKIAAGKKYTLLTSKDSLAKAQYFIYQPNAIEYVVYDLRDSLNIYKGQKEVTVKEQTVGGIINSSLYLTLQQTNASPALAVELSEIFAWSIDFYRIQKGDWFKAVYEQKYVEGEPIGIGKILAVEFNHFNHEFYGFYFDQGGKDDYFDEESNSLRKAFLKSPLKYSRLSSRFTMRRFHPVQKRWKAHLGTDYAAPRGTPIMSTGDGVITKSSYTKGNGKYVKVKHNSVYSTQYLHMSKRNVKVGQHVKQGDVIGYVGSTGLATGPHVCYRFWKNGKQVDHLRQDFPSAEPIKEEFMPQYQEKKKLMLQKLEGIQLEKQLMASNS